MTRRKRNLVIPLVAASLAVLAFVGVVVLQHRATGYRHAQATLADAESQFGEASTLPLALIDHAEPTQVIRQQLSAEEAGVNNAVAGLTRSWPTPALAVAAARIATDFRALNLLAGVVFSDPQLQQPTDALHMLQLGSSLKQEVTAVTASVQNAKDRYNTLASQADNEALGGTFLALAVLLAAFLVFYTRWLKLLNATRRDARSDALTGLGNRRALIEALDVELPAATEQDPLVLTVYDLDGFKAYNDSFGHLAGDALLARVAARLQATVGPSGNAYRMGGDEFCCLVSLSREEIDMHIEASRDALSETGAGFEIGCSAGCVLLPHEAATPDAALALADQRMYERKGASKRSATRQTADALLEVLNQRDSDLREHIGGVADLAVRTAQALALPEVEVEKVRLAAELHDVGKSAIPETILNKPAALNDEEWQFIRDHTLIGERIVRAAPALATVAQLIRSSHERVDGNGYPDGLAGESIPLGARIVAACDAFDAMTSHRPYRQATTVDEAVAELRRARGTQFDARVVDAVCAIVEQREPDQLAA